MKPDMKNSDTEGKSRRRGALWFAAGIVVTLIVVFSFPAIHDALENVGETTVQKAKNLQAQITRPSAAAASSSGRNPTFDFYRLLSHPTQILTSRESGEIKGSADSRTPISEPGRYVLQVASVKDAENAERLKAKLALWGIRSHIQTVEVKGATWHRIRVGPISRLKQLNALREKLDARGLRPLLIRVGQ